jgi:Tol biopolymer transport system component
MAGALLVLAGCDSTTTSPTGDSGGEHLVAYASDRNQAPGQFDIYLYDMDLLGFRSLPNLNSASAADLNPSLSSNGRLIAFESARAGMGVDILLYDRAAQPPGLVALPGVNTPADETEPEFSADLLKLAFVQVVNGFRRIRLIDGVPDTLLALPGLDTTGTFNDLSPAPSHDASTIAFASDRNGNSDVFVWRRGVGLLNLPALISPERDLDPALSGDGRYLCFASDRAGTEGDLDLYLFDFQDSTLTRLDLPSTVAIERQPSVSRDGSVISFTSNRDDGLGQLDVWNYNRVQAQVGQGQEQASTRDDVAPSLRWR